MPLAHRTPREAATMTTRGDRDERPGREHGGLLTPVATFDEYAARGRRNVAGGHARQPLHHHRAWARGISLRRGEGAPRSDRGQRSAAPRTASVPARLVRDDAATWLGDTC